MATRTQTAQSWMPSSQVDSPSRLSSMKMKVATPKMMMLSGWKMRSRLWPVRAPMMTRIGTTSRMS